jgi:DNA-binding Xre family transcriptional regulator
MDTNERIIFNIKKLARSKHITLKSICQNIGITEQGLNSMFKYKTLKLETVIKIACFLNTTLYQLCEEYPIDETRIPANDFSPMLKAELNQIYGYLRGLYDSCNEPTLEDTFPNFIKFIKRINTQADVF